MKILISAYTLDLSGVPTYTQTLYNELTYYRGHDVFVYSPKGGYLENCMVTYKDTSEIPTPDIIIAQHRDCAIALRSKFPNIPMIFSAHGFFDSEQRPPVEIQKFIAINENGVDDLVRHGVERNKIDIVRDFVDMNRFTSRSKIHDTVMDVLYVSNYKKGKTYQVILNSCKELGINMHAVGAPYGRAKKIEDDINSVDLVISSGRVILESMSCERAVISFEKERGYGYIAPENYWESRRGNFGWPTGPYYFEVDTLIEEIRKYTPISGKINREFVSLYHNSVLVTDQILGIIDMVLHDKCFDAK